MPLLESTDIDEIIEALGGSVTIDGGAVPVMGILAFETREIDNNGRTVWTDTIELSVSAATSALIDLNDTELTINGTDYQAFDKTAPDVSGMVKFFLTRDF